MDADDPEADVPPEAPLADDVVFYETVVELRPDGAVVSEPRAITVGEQRAQNEWKAAVSRGEVVASLNNDGGCSAQAVWLYSRTDWTGNRICFRGIGQVDLAQYYYFWQGIPISDWTLKQGSVWPGEGRGSLTDGPTWDAGERAYHGWNPWSPRTAFSTAALGKPNATFRYLQQSN